MKRNRAQQGHCLLPSCLHAGLRHSFREHASILPMHTALPQRQMYAATKADVHSNQGSEVVLKPLRFKSLQMYLKVKRVKGEWSDAANQKHKENEVHYRLGKKSKRSIILQSDQRLRTVLWRRECKSDIKQQA